MYLVVDESGDTHCVSEQVCEEKYGPIGAATVPFVATPTDAVPVAVSSADSAPVASAPVAAGPAQ